MINEFRKINSDSIKSAGARYTPIVEAGAPNLEIEPSVEIIDAISLSPAYRKKIEALANRLGDAWDQRSEALRNGFRGRKQNPLELARLFRLLSSEEPGTSIDTTRRIARTLRFCRQRVSAIQSSLHQEVRGSEEHSEEHQRVSSEQSCVRKLSSALYEVAEFVNSPAFKSITTNRLLFLGEWGVGKTHFLCDITRLRQDESLPTLIVLAHKLPKKTNPLHAISSLVPSVSNTDQLLQQLNRLGQQAGGRALLIFEGINEGDRETWANSVGDLSRTLAGYQNVGLILSCRTPYDHQIFTEHDRRSFSIYVHPGFNEIEIDAQNEFFRHYSIPTPNIPLLADEFSRPLFLKILCKTLQSFADRTKRRRINEIASGHRSMTTIFEDFIKQVGKGAEHEFQLPRKTCWWILKGKRPKGGSDDVGIAVEMANRQIDWLSRDQVIQVVRQHTNFDENTCRLFLDRLVLDGLLAEDMIYYEDGWIETIRMPYQRFSDHLISRHLLRKHLNTNSVDTIRRSFYRNRPLGRVFELENGGHNYKRPGIASALMLEFPERIKRVAPPNERELIFYLPKDRRRVSPSVDVFLESLIWRDADSFSEQTHFLVAFLLKRGNNHIRGKVLDTLVCLATRSAHSDTAERFFSYLHSLSLTERDLLWSEFLCQCDASSTPHRVLRWIEDNHKKEAGEHDQSILIPVLQWFLTTTHRATRDRATRALVWIGEVDPGSLFDQTIKSLACNDPYISERMLAASYGVLMRGWWEASRSLTNKSSEFSRAIYDAMFARRGKHRTKHILSREYALGIVEIGKKLAPHCLGARDQKLLLAPFSTFRGPIPSPQRIKDEDCAGAETAISMDFGNYTIGRLIEGRRNYDFEHKGYKEIRRQIEWRVVNLGYDEDLFRDVDRRLSEDNFRMGRSESPSRIDRYGKKYSWIAFYEVAGKVQDRSRPGSVFSSERISDIDIDPSFPEPPKYWQPTLKPVFPRNSDVATWVTGGAKPNYTHLLQSDQIDSIDGPWVLLDSYVEEKSKSDPRHVFTFLRGIFVSQADARNLIRAFRRIEYPGNHAIPSTGEDYYTFAGEVAWCPRFATYLFESEKNSWLRNLVMAFSESRSRKVKKRFGDLDPHELLQWTREASGIGALEAMLTQQGQGLLIEEDQLVEIDEYYTTPGIEIEVPVWTNSWESYHSVVNQGGGFEYPAPALCEFLRLNSVRGEADLLDEHGQVASLFRVCPKSDELARSHFLYLRKDLLERYLEHTNQKLIWLNWGERQVHWSEAEKYRGVLQDVLTTHEHIHRSVRRF